MSNEDSYAPRDAGRRALLKRAGAVGAAATAGAVAPVATLTPAVAGAQSRTPPPREALETLTAAESDTLEAICARIIPTDENGPGAAEARAAHYIDRALAGPLAGSKAAYVSGLAAVDACARSTRGAPFARLDAQAQDAVLTDFEKNAAKAFLANPARFFNMVRMHTLQGTFSDPYYGGNANYVGWDLIGYPGIRMTVSAAEQSISRPPKVLRKSAYDEAMFSKQSGKGGAGHGH